MKEKHKNVNVEISNTDDHTYNYASSNSITDSQNITEKSDSFGEENANQVNIEGEGEKW